MIVIVGLIKHIQHNGSKSSCHPERAISESKDLGTDLTSKVP